MFSKTVFAAAFVAAMTVAGASQARVAIKFGDLDMTNANGVTKLDARIEGAARTFCASEARVLTVQASCRAAIRAEAKEKLSKLGVAKAG